MALHDAIRHLRVYRGIKQDVISEKLGISQAAYSRMESGKVKIDTRILKKLADILEVSQEDLLKESPLIIHNQHNQGQVGNSNSILINEGNEEFYRAQLAEKDKQISLLLIQLEELTKIIKKLQNP